MASRSRDLRERPTFVGRSLQKIKKKKIKEDKTFRITETDGGLCLSVGAEQFSL